MTSIPAMRDRWFARACWAGVVLVTTIAGSLASAGATASAPRSHSILVKAGQYAFDPPVIRVRRGDTLKLRFAASDVVHGFYLEGHDLDVAIPPLSRQVTVKRGGATQVVEEVVLTAGRSGKFRYRCSKTCGAMHPFMVGELIVGPNRLFGGAAGAAAGLLFGGFVSVLVGAKWRAS
jgi:heme/copper-type cytochrome/quinol oxidase subunit 2